MSLTPADAEISAAGFFHLGAFPASLAGSQPDLIREGLQALGYPVTS